MEETAQSPESGERAAPSAEIHYTLECDECFEGALVPEGINTCPWCGSESVTLALDPTPRNVAAQEKVVVALWELGARGPALDEAGHARPEFSAAVGPALETIMKAFGFEVTPIQ